MRKIIYSKWSKRILWVVIISSFLIYEYILLFIGTRNTYIDEFCLPICVIALGMMLIRAFLIEEGNELDGIKAEMVRRFVKFQKNKKKTLKNKKKNKGNGRKKSVQYKDI